MDTCPVCTSHYTSSVRREVTCPKCDYTACLTCYKQYFSFSGTHPCINPDCKVELPESVIYNVFPKVYVQKEYKNKLLTKSYEEERSMIPKTLIIIARREQAKELREEIEELSRLMASKRNLMYNLQQNMGDDVKDDVQQFIRQCSSNDCQGFLNRQYHCGVCKKHFCSACLEEKKDNHECNPEVLQTVGLIKKDSKPCPGCSALIHKIEGCNQMYCTVCHTSFDWTTRRIITKNIHNPHYYQYLREQGRLEREPGDIPCGGIPQRFVIESSLRNANNLHLAEYYDGLHQFVGDIRHDKLPNYAPSQPFKHNLDNRIKFIKKEITEEDFKRRLKIHNTYEMKKEKIHQVLSTVAILIEDQLRNASMTNDHQSILDECKCIMIYINKCFYDNEKIYNCTMPRITYRNGERWDNITRTYTVYKEAWLMLSYGRDTAPHRHGWGRGTEC